jgi:hypothetical protein
MRHFGFISGKPIISDADFIVLSHIEGVLSEHGDLESAQDSLHSAKASCASWGRPCDAAIFHWSGFDWRAVNTFYTEQEARVSRNRMVWP